MRCVVRDGAGVFVVVVTDRVQWQGLSQALLKGLNMRMDSEYLDALSHGCLATGIDPGEWDVRQAGVLEYSAHTLWVCCNVVGVFLCLHMHGQRARI